MARLEPAISGSWQLAELQLHSENSLEMRVLKARGPSTAWSDPAKRDRHHLAQDARS